MSNTPEEVLSIAEGHFLVHFILADGSHDMDALVLHACEGELLGLIKEVGKQLDVDLRIEARAYGKGGIEVYLTFVGKHAVALGLIGATVTAICSSVVWWNYQSTLLEQQITQNEFNLQRDKKLTEQQIEQNELNLKKARIELKKQEQEASPVAQKAPATAATKSLPLEPPPKVEDVLPALLSSRRVIKLRSQFYETLLSYEKVTAVGFAPMHKPTHNEQQIVRRANFDSYVVKLVELEPTLVLNAEVEIVAPVLKRGSFKWRGVFEKRGISFELADEDFLACVMSKKVKFQNGTTLVCDLKVHLRENEAGEAEPHTYVVGQVHKHYNKGSINAADTLMPPHQYVQSDQIQALKEPHDDAQLDLRLPGV